MTDLGTNLYAVLEDLEFCIRFERDMRDGRSSAMIRKWEKERDHLEMLLECVFEGDLETALDYLPALSEYTRSRLREAGMPEKESR